MNAHQTASLTFKICGLFVWVSNVPTFVLYSFGLGNEFTPIWALPYLAMGALLFFMSGLLARLVVGAPAGTDSPSSAHLQSIAYSVLGLYLILAGLIQLESTWWVSYISEDTGNLRLQLRTASLIEIGLGVWIFLGNRGLAALVRGAQRLGFKAGASRDLKRNEVQTIAFSVVGLYFTVSGVIGIARLPMVPLGGSAPASALVAIAIQIGLGPAIFFGSGILAEWWARLLSSPSDTSASTPEQPSKDADPNSLM